MLRFCGALAKESFVDVHGVAVRAHVAACSISHMELSIQRLYCVSRSLPVLPLLPEDAGGASLGLQPSRVDTQVCVCVCVCVCVRVYT